MLKKKKPTNPDSIRARLQARPANSKQMLGSGANVMMPPEHPYDASSKPRMMQKGKPIKGGASMFGDGR